MRHYLPLATLVWLGACGTPTVLTAPLAQPVADQAQAGGTPLPAYAEPLGPAAAPFAGPDPASPEGGKPATIPLDDLKPAIQ
jgi:hypothetical protein